LTFSVLWVWRLEARKPGESVIDANKRGQERPGNKVISNRLILSIPGFSVSLPMYFRFQPKMQQNIKHILEVKS